MTVATLDRAELLRELLAREEAMTSLASFIEYCSGLPVPRHMKFICDKLDEVIAGKCTRLMVSLPPGYGKSWVISHYFPAFYFAKNPKHNIIFATHKQELSDSFGGKVQRTLMSEEFQRLFPDVGVSKEKTANSDWLTTGDGSYHATSVGANVTGRRGNILIGDDLLSGIQAAESESERSKLWSWYGADFSTRRKNQHTPIILVGTRWHIADHLGRLEQGEKSGDGDKWERIVLPAVAGDKDPLGREPGEALWPAEFPIEFLERTKRSPEITNRMWHALYQCSPTVDTGGIIDAKWFKWYKAVEPPKIEYILQSWDTAMGARKGSAFSACTTWGVWEDDAGIKNLIMLASWRDRVEWPVLRQMAQRMARDYRDDTFKDPIKQPKRTRKPDTILVEAKANGGMLIRDMALAGVTATPFNPDRYGDKIARVRLSTDLIENGRVWLPAQPPHFENLRPWAQEFVDNCVAFPASDSRDLVDTMTQALLRIKQSGWVHNLENPQEPQYTNGGAQRAPFY